MDGARSLRLHEAFVAGDLEAIRSEVGELDDFPNVDLGPAMGPCLTYAIYHGPLSLVRDLLAAGADPNRPADDGFPPLIAAFDAGADRQEIIELLLARGAEVGQRGVNDFTAMHLAAFEGDLPLVGLLIEHGADPDEITRIDDYETPLEVAERAGHTAVADRLRPLTVRLDWEHAGRVGDVVALRRMVEAGYDIDARDGYGRTALMRAAHAGQPATVAWLIDRGADLDHTSKYGLSALMLAVIAGHDRVARALVAAGADTSRTGTGAPGFAGKTAADLAEDNDDRRLAAFIRRGG